MKKQLDFICIGAAKSATSTLFELIKNHPEIYIPPEKEVPYFNDDEEYKKSWDWYIETFFSTAKNNQKAGTITPQYMSGKGGVTPQVICDRITTQNPEIKIIAMLRHPVERSYSHFRMHKRQGHLEEGFNDAVNRLIDNSNLDTERKSRSLTNAFLFGSEYGDILGAYYRKLPKNNILIIYTDEFSKNTKKELRRVFKFLHVDQSYLPPKIDIRENQGGDKAKIKYLSGAYLKKFPLIDKIWKFLVPPKLRKKIYYRLLIWNTRKDSNQLSPSSPAYKKLVEYFKQDIELLESATSQKVPWSEWEETN